MVRLQYTITSVKQSIAAYTIVTIFCMKQALRYYVVVLLNCNAVKYVFSANTVLILIQYFLAQISVLKLTEFFIARN